MCKLKAQNNRNDSSSYISQETPTNSNEISVNESARQWYNSEIREAKINDEKSRKLRHKHSNEFCKNPFALEKNQSEKWLPQINVLV